MKNKIDEIITSKGRYRVGYEIQVINYNTGHKKFAKITRIGKTFIEVEEPNFLSKRAKFNFHPTLIKYKNDYLALIRKSLSANLINADYSTSRESNYNGQWRGFLSANEKELSIKKTEEAERKNKSPMEWEIVESNISKGGEK